MNFTTEPNNESYWMLKRIIRFNEIERCYLTHKILRYGDYYYEDSANSKIKIDAIYFDELRRRHKEENFDYTRLNTADSVQEYEEMLRDSQREYVEATLFDKPILGNGNR